MTLAEVVIALALSCVIMLAAMVMIPAYGRADRDTSQLQDLYFEAQFVTDAVQDWLGQAKNFPVQLSKPYCPPPSRLGFPGGESDGGSDGGILDVGPEEALGEEDVNGSIGGVPGRILIYTGRRATPPWECYDSSIKDWTCYYTHEFEMLYHEYSVQHGINEVTYTGRLTRYYFPENTGPGTQIGKSDVNSEAFWNGWMLSAGIESEVLSENAEQTCIADYHEYVQNKDTGSLTEDANSQKHLEIQIRLSNLQLRNEKQLDEDVVLPAYYLTVVGRIQKPDPLLIPFGG